MGGTGRNLISDAWATISAGTTVDDLDMRVLYAATARGFLEQAKEELARIEIRVSAVERENVRLSKVAT